jgi:hypothetical protein
MPVQQVLEKPVLIVCGHCKGIAVDTLNFNPPLKTAPVPEDWSFLKIGTTGAYMSDPFAVIGRIRLQLKNDYKNLWTAVCKSGKPILIVESFASFSVLQTQRMPYPHEMSKLRAGKEIALTNPPKLIGEYLEKCVDVTYEGENYGWFHLNPGFYLMQASNSRNETALFPFVPNAPIEFLSGEKVTVKSLQLTNIITWHEWQ